MKKPARLLDYIGISASTLCLIHCFALPVLMLLAPALSLDAVHNESLHFGLLCLVVPLAFVAYLHGYSQHKQKWILGMGLGAIAILIVPLILGLEGEHAHAAAESVSHAGHDHHHHHHEQHSVFELGHLISFVGSLGLITAHIFNTRAHKCGDHECSLESHSEDGEIVGDAPANQNASQVALS